MNFEFGVDQSIARRKVEKPFFELNLMGKQQPKMAVTTASMDDIGSVLSGLGFDWSSYQIGSLLGNNRPDVLFVNCGSDVTDADLPRFVETGGVVYISDHAYRDFDAIAIAAKQPSTINLSGRAGTYKATVEDQDLAFYLGVKSLDIEFDMGSWAEINVAPNNARILLKVEGKPILLSMRYGKGSAIFTSFHNSAQKSDIEMKLIQFLALKPLLRSRTIKTSDETTRRGGNVLILDEIEPVFKFNSTYNKLYDLPPKSQSFCAEVNWLGDAEISVTLSSNGTILKQINERLSPLRISLDSLPKGPIEVSGRLINHHEDGLITSMVVSITESDDDERETLRNLLSR